LRVRAPASGQASRDGAQRTHQPRPPLPQSFGWLFHTVANPMLIAELSGARDPRRAAPPTNI